MTILADFAESGHITLPLPQTPVWHIPKGWIVYFPAEVNANFTGDGELTARIVPVHVHEAGFSGSGSTTGAIFAIAYEIAAFSGSGTATASVIRADSVLAQFSGSGTLTAEAERHIPVFSVAADFTGVGNLNPEGFSEVEITPATASGSGTATGVAREVEFADADFNGSGTLSAVSSGQVNFTPAGVLKSGTQQLSSSNAWHQVTGWVVDPNYSGTNLVSNAIVTEGGGEVLLSAAVAWSTANGNRQCRIKVNGNVVATSTTTTGTPTISDFSTVLAPGDLVTLEAYTTTVFTAYRVIAASGTFLRMDAVIPLVLRGSDSFDGTGALGSDWHTTGGGTLVRTGGLLDGTNTPSVPLSYAWWADPMPSDDQIVRAVLRWNGRDPEHSACGLVVRANPYQDPVTNPGAQFGVQFSFTRGIMALYYEDYDAPNGFVALTAQQYVNTSKFPEGALLELSATGNLYVAKVNGTTVLQGTCPDSAIPFSNRYVGLTIQNDELETGGGGPPGFLDDFEAYTK